MHIIWVSHFIYTLRQCYQRRRRDVHWWMLYSPSIHGTITSTRNEKTKMGLDARFLEDSMTSPLFLTTPYGGENLLVVGAFIHTNRMMLQTSIAIQIRQLLQKSHLPRVRIQPSTIPDSGLGVFYHYDNDFETEQCESAKDSSNTSTSTCNDTTTTTSSSSAMGVGTVACLYPGIYTPPIPMAASCANSLASNDYYLAGQWTPSGIKAESNAYILNLQDSSWGGYLDGLALKDTNETMAGPQKLQLDANPSACGHLINHNPDGSNVQVISFRWCDVFELSTALNEEDTYDIPNRLRCDGSPWYYDEFENKLVHFPNRATSLETDSAASIHEVNYYYQQQVCGAAIVLSHQVESGEELFLDYGLHEPYPEWAEGWYRKTSIGQTVLLG